MDPNIMFVKKENGRKVSKSHKKTKAGYLDIVPVRRWDVLLTHGKDKHEMSPGRCLGFSKLVLIKNVLNKPEVYILTIFAAQISF